MLLYFSFKEYGQPERAQIANALATLPVYGGGTTPPEICLPLEEAWVRGTLDEVARKADEVTANTKKIAWEFLELPQDDPARKVGYYWEVEQDQTSPSVLWIHLCLISPSSDDGLLILGQQILRVGEDEYIYWGVD